MAGPLRGILRSAATDEKQAGGGLGFESTGAHEERFGSGAVAGLVREAAVREGRDGKVGTALRAVLCFRIRPGRDGVSGSSGVSCHNVARRDTDAKQSVTSRCPSEPTPERG